MLRLSLAILAIIPILLASALNADREQPVAPPVIHPAIGKTATSPDGRFSITLVTRKQNYEWSGTTTSRDPDVVSPKSVNITPDGKRYYINSLEGARTICYDMASGDKLSTIHHTIGKRHRALWTGAEEIYPFDTIYRHPRVFTGKPVEGAFSHAGRYLWIPYYRRSYDLNAQDPSAIAVIDTSGDSIVRLIDTGPLPKMIAASPDGRHMAVAHWGNNTVGIIDIASDSPADWHHEPYHIIDYKLKLGFSRTEPVNRDTGSGNALRGTVFTPCSRYLLVGCMGGTGGIAVIDMVARKYKGKLTGMMPNVRHLDISNDGYLYLSINKGGYLQRLSLDSLYRNIECMEGKTRMVTGWQSCKVGAGARTVSLSPDGRIAYVACNTVSKLYAIDTATMTVLVSIDADSYPVGLDVSPDGHTVIVTSQGRPGAKSAGNAIDIYKVVSRLDQPSVMHK